MDLGSKDFMSLGKMLAPQRGRGIGDRRALRKLRSFASAGVFPAPSGLSSGSRLWPALTQFSALASEDRFGSRNYGFGVDGHEGENPFIDAVRALSAGGY
jgi:hypothetical protein